MMELRSDTVHYKKREPGFSADSQTAGPPKYCHWLSFFGCRIYYNITKIVIHVMMKIKI